HDLGNDFLAHGGEEPLEGLDRPFPADPEQAGDADVDLIDPGQVLWPFGDWISSTPMASICPSLRWFIFPVKTLSTASKTVSQEVRKARVSFREAGAPSGPGRAGMPSSECACRHPRVLPQQ